MRVRLVVPTSRKLPPALAITSGTRKAPPIGVQNRSRSFDDGPEGWRKRRAKFALNGGRHALPRQADPPLIKPSRGDLLTNSREHQPRSFSHAGMPLPPNQGRNFSLLQ